jgi:hypothetical protein
MVAKKPPWKPSTSFPLYQLSYQFNDLTFLFSTGIAVAHYISRNDGTERTAIGKNR